MRFALLGVVVLLTSAGCAGLQEYQSDRLYHRLAAEAWRAAPDVPRDGPAARHFERGWKQGYYDLARGGDGSLPVLPPQSYWSFKYKSPAGQQFIRTWFDAYALGALAAKIDGAQDAHYLVVSPEAVYGPLGAPIVAPPTFEALPTPERVDPAPEADSPASGSAGAPPGLLSPANEHERSPLGDAGSAWRIELIVPTPETLAPQAPQSESSHPPVVGPEPIEQLDRAGSEFPWQIVPALPPMARQRVSQQGSPSSNAEESPAVASRPSDTRVERQSAAIWAEQPAVPADWEPVVYPPEPPAVLAEHRPMASIRVRATEALRVNPVVSRGPHRGEPATGKPRRPVARRK